MQIVRLNPPTFEILVFNLAFDLASFSYYYNLYSFYYSLFEKLSFKLALFFRTHIRSYFTYVYKLIKIANFYPFSSRRIAIFLPFYVE